MRVTGSVEGDIAAILKDEANRIADQVVVGVRASGVAVQAQLRAQVKAAGLGPGLEKAWQRISYPRGRDRTASPAELVYSKSTILHAVFSEGAVISARAGRYLAIPTREAEALGLATTNIRRDGKGTGAVPRHASQVQRAIEQLGAQNTRTVPIGQGRMLVIYRAPAGRGAGITLRRKLGVKRGQDVPLFILVPQVRLGAVLDLAGVRAGAADLLAANVASALGA